MLASILVLSVLATETTRAYFVGNSVTDALNYSAFEKLFEARDRKLVWGRHVIPGTPLFLPWKGAEAGRTDGFTQGLFGNSVEALTRYDWDVVTLQPFDRHEKDIDKDGYDEGDLASARRYIAAAVKRNPKVRILIYARWPRMTVSGKSVTYDKTAYLEPAPRPKAALPPGLDDWASLWRRSYTGGWDGTNETKEYFERITRDIREAVAPTRVEMIPVGHAMSILDGWMKAGKVPGYRTIWDLYQDGIHLEPAGSLLVGLSFYTAITGEKPHGLPRSAYGVDDPALGKAIEDAVWQAHESAPYGRDKATPDSLAPSHGR
jgi:hypothetical protein